jgi:hypothetical protein
VSGGLPPYSFSITAGQLPPGTQLAETDNGDGTTTVTLEGTPTTEGDFSFDLSVDDASGASASMTVKAAAKKIVSAVKSVSRR